MSPKSIQNETEYQTVLARIDKLMDVAPGSAEEDELDVLVGLVVSYEEVHFPI